MIKRAPDPRAEEPSPSGKKSEADQEKIARTPGTGSTRPTERSAFSQTTASLPIILLVEKKDLPPGSPGKLTLSQTSSSIPVVIPPGKKPTPPAASHKETQSDTISRIPVVIPPGKKKQPSTAGKFQSKQPIAIPYLKRLRRLKRPFIWYLVALAGILSIILSFTVSIPVNNGQPGGSTLAQGIGNFLANRQNGNVTSRPQGQPQAPGQGQTPGQGQGNGQTDGIGQTPVGVSGNWKMVFHDEFNGTALDRSKWTTCYTNPNFKIGANDCIHDQSELELYRPENVLLSNGVLTLQANHQDVTAGGQTFHYPSGMISSDPTALGGNGGFAFTYGYAEMRTKIPAGQGLWPAFWLLPQDGSWPPEIDVFEFLCNAPNVDQMHYHYPGGGDQAVGTAWSGPDFSAGWHVFGIDWEPGSLTWYVDGVVRFQTSTAVTSKPMYLLANLAVGGGWPGPPDASTPFPANFQINYIRVWQH